MGRIKPLGLIGLMGLMILMGLVGCSEDSDLENRNRVTFEAQSLATGFEQEQSGHAPSSPSDVTTRAWTPPTGYYLYTDDNVMGLFAQQTDLFYKSIDVFFTQDGKEPMHGAFSYKKPYGENPGTWRLNMEIEDPGDYYVYGYIPKEAANSATIAGNSSYSEGAELTINGIKTITHSDVCVIVGAKDGTDADHATSSEAPYASLATGDFKVHANKMVMSSEPEVHNYIYLLFDHLYAALAFRFTIDETYDALRTIRVRKLELIGYDDASETSIKARYNVKVKLKGNTTGSSPIEEVTFTPDPTSGDLAMEPIYESPDAYGVALAHNTHTDFMGCFVPGQNTNFKLRTTYDVYDKNQAKDKQGNLIFDSEGQPVYNLIRYGCVADNAFDLQSTFPTTGSLRGKMFQLTIKVAPTYLYVLSEPDVDNPTITIEN